MAVVVLHAGQFQGDLGAHRGGSEIKGSIEVITFLVLSCFASHLRRMGETIRCIAHT